MVYEYKVIPAPVKGRKARGVRKPEDKFALAVQESMNELAQLGWEFLRSETLPNTERTGLTRRTTTERSVLVFRREIAQEPKSSLEATLREVEKPKPVAAAPVTESPTTEVTEPEVPEVAAAPITARDDAQTVVPMNKPLVAEQAPTDDPAPSAPKKLSAVETESFPDPRPVAPQPTESQALYTKDSVKPAKTAKTNALPAALRSRASQTQEGKKA